MKERAGMNIRFEAADEQTQMKGAVALQDIYNHPNRPKFMHDGKPLVENMQWDGTAKETGTALIHTHQVTLPVIEDKAEREAAMDAVITQLDALYPTKDDERKQGFEQDAVEIRIPHWDPNDDMANSYRPITIVADVNYGYKHVADVAQEILNGLNAQSPSTSAEGDTRAKTDGAPLKGNARGGTQ